MSFLRMVAVMALVGTFSAVFARDAAAAEPAGPVVTQSGNSFGSGVLANRLTDRAPTKRRWYGWQPLAIDVSAFATFGTALYVGRNDRGMGFLPWAYGATATYALGAPITHLAHGQYASAGLSLGLRVATPTLAGLAASALTPRQCETLEGNYEWCHTSAAPTLAAVTVGLLAAMSIDDALLSWEPVKEQPGFAFSPTLAWDGKRGASAGVAGTF